LSNFDVFPSLVIALISQAVSHILHPAQEFVIPSTDAPGIFVTQPKISPAGQATLQNGL
jgi:hypothetical protein